MSYQEALSFSKRYVWSACRQKYQYTYIQRLKRLPSDMPLEQWQRFSRGNLIHACLESAFRGEDMATGIARAQERFERDGLTVVQRQLLPDMQSSAQAVASKVAAWLPVSDWEPLTHNGVSLIEAKLHAPLAGWPGGFIGYADLIAKHRPSGLTFIIDYKSRERFDADDVGQYDVQLAAYQHCAKVMGIEVHGTALVEIKPELPKRKPKFARVDTGDFYGVRESPDGTIRFTPTKRSDALVATLWADLSREALAISKHHRDPAEIWRNSSAYNCNGCAFKRVCLGAANGEDAEFLQNNTFEVILSA